MYAKTLIVSALAVLASAQLPAVQRRDFAELQARQTALDPSCTDALASLLPLYSSLPTPPPDFPTQTGASDPCATPTYTGAALSAYSSYSSVVQVWYSSNSAAIFGALGKCPSLTQYASGIPICTSAGLTTSTGSAATTGSASRTSGAAGSASSSASAVTKNAAARETGMVAAGLAAAGFVVAVAAL